MRTFTTDDGYTDYAHGDLVALETLKKPGTLRTWTIRFNGKAVRRGLSEHRTMRALVRLSAVGAVLTAACATPQKPAPRPDPKSSPDRCFVLAEAVCQRVVECSGSEVQQGECLHALEAGCQDVAGITNQEMLDCLREIRKMPCDGTLPEECNDIATSASEEATPRQGELRCER